MDIIGILDLDPHENLCGSKTLMWGDFLKCYTIQYLVGVGYFRIVQTPVKDPKLPRLS